MNYSTRDALPLRRGATRKDPDGAPTLQQRMTGRPVQRPDGEANPAAEEGTRAVECRLYYDQDRMVDCTYGVAMTGPQDQHVLVRVLDVPPNFTDADVAMMVADHHHYCCIAGTVPFYQLSPWGELVKLTSRVRRLEEALRKAGTDSDG